jgi:predicted NAD-dependent protein-ADP-ribosyltransferase YbiA (DUF1768 family)
MAHLVDYIREYYPGWLGYKEYPADKAAVVGRVIEPWGLLGNFAPSPLTVDGVSFDCTEKLFQVMQFSAPDARRVIYSQPRSQAIKRKANHYKTVGAVREDWGRIFIDAMKFCLMQKYQQCEAFRQELERSKGLFIVEKEANSKRPAGAWSAKLSDDGSKWTGPNIMGRLLMELRDNGTLSYNLPEDVMNFSDLA